MICCPPPCCIARPSSTFDSLPRRRFKTTWSQRRQYDLVEEARHRGFVQVEVIDDDLGRSAIGMVARPGFDHLVAGLCAGEVGAVLCFDASRLARNIRSYGLRSPFSLKFLK
ncbi:recombinase family protein [Polaromonas sp. AET17H-212]|uniref:recombinase family protein n=1 Tax=Polaromonas sp. AET17H-212 TaxID=1977061 RepID=UPI0020D0CBD8|nr:recombinase family protein [Polaromonas sp. AET17H-212]